MKKLKYLTRSQLQTIHNLGGERNAQKVLKSMEEYLNSFREGETVYYLSKAGAERVDFKGNVKKTTTARHYIMRNALYIAFNQPDTWKNEVKMRVKEVATIICDATFTIGKQRYIVEIDHEQKMVANRKKLEKYCRLVDAGVFEIPPIFLWMTTTEYRQKQLIKMHEGLDSQIFILSDFQ
ncbi:replication-relaxation family protein [Priestia koreensis]|uniref:replication-relaxation family protein n=1 Tax=Priestia koreensis TaxID=284581 RepID=UPI00316AC250